MCPFNKIIFITENRKQPVMVFRIKGILKKMKSATGAVLKGVLKNNCSQSCLAKLHGKILKKIPMKKKIFSKVSGF